MLGTKYRVLEFYSGVGGMHYALEQSNIPYEVLQAFEISDICTKIYKHNFPNNKVVPKLIETFPFAFFADLCPDIWTLSPPCQPFTRTGIQLGEEDKRSASFVYLLDEILPRLDTKPKFIIIENVKGFDESSMRDRMIQVLGECGYYVEEFLLSPMQFGIPNMRLRYYCLARLITTDPVSVESSQIIPSPGPIRYTLPSLPPQPTFEPAVLGKIAWREAFTPENLVREYNCREIGEFLQHDLLDEELEKFWMPEKQLRYWQTLDIVDETMRKTNCFTKAYYHYAQGTGSVLHHKGRSRSRPRYFTPREIANLMGFPPSFSFPTTVSLKQQYRALGNSLSVSVVSELIKYLIHQN